MNTLKSYIIAGISIAVIFGIIIIGIIEPHGNNQNQQNFSNDNLGYKTLISFYANDSGIKSVEVNISWVGIRMEIEYNSSFIISHGQVSLIMPNGYPIIMLTVMSKSEEENTEIKGAESMMFNSNTIPPDIKQDSLWNITWNYSGGPVKVTVEKIFHKTTLPNTASITINKFMVLGKIKENETSQIQR